MPKYPKSRVLGAKNHSGSKTYNRINIIMMMIIIIVNNNNNNSNSDNNYSNDSKNNNRSINMSRVWIE